MRKVTFIDNTTRNGSVKFDVSTKRAENTSLYLRHLITLNEFDVQVASPVLLLTDKIRTLATRVDAKSKTDL